MNYVLGCALVLVGVGLYIQRRAWKARSANLEYLRASLEAEPAGGRILVFTDDKELKGLLVQVNRVLERLQEEIAGYQKTKNSMRKMLANISHDLKTPLTVVMGYIESLRFRGNALPAEQLAVLEKAYAKAQEMLALISRFFDLAKLEAGDWEVPLTRVNLNEAARKSMLSFFDVLAKEKLEVAVEIPKQEVYIMGNEEALGRIIDNLVDNAVKYGKSGGSLGLILRSDEDRAFLDIWDNGPGIPSQEQGRIFDRLYTLEDSRSPALQSSGLGLAIVGRLVEKLGGSITLKSEPWEKTTFTCCFKRLLS